MSTVLALNIGQRIATGTALKAVGSYSRLTDYRSTNDPLLMNAAMKREASMLSTVAAGTFALEHVYGQMQGVYKAFPALARHRNVMQFLPLMAAYGLAEVVSKHVSGLSSQLRRATADDHTVVDAGNAKTVNLFLNSLNGDPTKAASNSVKIAELQFAAQPMTAMNSLNAARAYYQYPVAYNPAYNPFTQGYRQN